MADIQPRKEFVANLQAELGSIKAFYGTLSKEHRTLVKGNIEDLDYFASEKKI